jgi:hypothetical protein
MTDDKQRAAERRRRMNELLAEAETNVARTRAAKSEPDDSPVVDQRSSTWWGTLLTVVVLLTLAALFGLTAMTVGRFSGADFKEANRTGTATVEQCERHGPITLKGFGYYDRCTVKIAWGGGLTGRYEISEPGFIQGEKPGDFFEIGENSGTRGSTSFSRPEYPNRGWVGWLAVILGVLALIPGATGLYITAYSIRSPIRRS